MEIEKLNEGSVIIYAHAVGFYHEAHRQTAGEKIQRGEAINEAVWGAHQVLRPPEHTMRKHRASHWLQTQRDQYLVQVVQPATAVTVTTLGMRKGCSPIVCTTLSTGTTLSRPMAPSVSSSATRVSRGSVHFAPTPANTVVEITPYSAETPQYSPMPAQTPASGMLSISSGSPLNQSPFGIVLVPAQTPACAMQSVGSTSPMNQSPFGITLAAPTPAAPRAHALPNQRFYAQGSQNLYGGVSASYWPTFLPQSLRWGGRQA